jgi:hypothetical protein
MHKIGLENQLREVPKKKKGQPGKAALCKIQYPMKNRDKNSSHCLNLQILHWFFYPQNIATALLMKWC